jgi:hypothetical protein
VILHGPELELAELVLECVSLVPGGDPQHVAAAGQSAILPGQHAIPPAASRQTAAVLGVLLKK